MKFFRKFFKFYEFVITYWVYNDSILTCLEKINVTTSINVSINGIKHQENSIRFFSQIIENPRTVWLAFIH